MAQEAKILRLQFHILHEIKDIDRYKGLKFTNMMLNATDDDGNFYCEWRSRFRNLAYEIITLTGTTPASGDMKSHIKSTIFCETPRNLSIVWHNAGLSYMVFLFWLKTESQQTIICIRYNRSTFHTLKTEFCFNRMALHFCHVTRPESHIS